MIPAESPAASLKLFCDLDFLASDPRVVTPNSESGATQTKQIGKNVDIIRTGVDRPNGRRVKKE